MGLVANPGNVFKESSWPALLWKRDGTSMRRLGPAQHSLQPVLKCFSMHPSSAVAVLDLFISGIPVESPCDLFLRNVIVAHTSILIDSPI